MSESESTDKTEQPTPRKREKARKEGQTASSQEVGVAVAVIVLVIGLLWVLPVTTATFLRTAAGMLDRPTFGSLTVPEATEAVIAGLLASAALVLPVAFIMMVLGTLLSIAQVGIHLNFENAGLKWSRLNPQNWLKKVFSVELPVNLAKSLLKGLGVVAVAVLGVHDLPERLWRLSGVPAGVLAKELGGVAFAVASRVATLLVLLAIFDVLWSRHRHEQKLRMSRQELKDEMKDSEGNPQVRAVMRRRMGDIGRKRLRTVLADATVVTTNPTHYAVALRYWRGKDSCPVVVAKGIDFRAARIRALAAELGIPVIEDKPLARTLYALVPEGRGVPEDLYRSVARLLAVVYRRRGAISRGEP